MPVDQSRRRAVTLASVILYTVIVIAILGVVNFLANRYDKTYDSTSNKKFTLSEQSRKIVKNLNQDVTISYWDKPDNFERARDLFERYKTLSPHVTVKYTDPDKKFAQAKAEGVTNYGNIFIEVGNKKVEAKSLTEEDVTGALVKALKGGDREVCFVLGSGEHSADNTDRDGYSQAKEIAEKSSYKTQTIKLIPKSEIPKDCTVVVVPGPKLDYVQPEADALKAYVENGGRALFMLDPPLKIGAQATEDNAPLTNVLESWGVTPQKDLVFDLSGVGQLFGLGEQYVLVTSYENQPIVRDLKDIPTGFPIARSLEVMNTDKTSIDKLFSSPGDSMATKNLAQFEHPSPEGIRLTKNDLKGPLLLAAAGTYTTGKETGNGRFIVVGSSSWAANSFLKFNGNKDLFANMLNWLSSDEDLISIRPKEPSDNPLNMNARQVSYLFYDSVIAIPLLVFAAGVGVWWRRR